MTADDAGLLGDLPRIRPGNRSSKRPARDAPRAPDPTPAQPAGRTAGDAATEPLRLAVEVAEAGLKAASRITGGLIRRVPRL